MSKFSVLFFDIVKYGQELGDPMFWTVFVVLALLVVELLVKVFVRGSTATVSKLEKPGTCQFYVSR